MTPFNYKNAYKLAIQTNKELHMSIDSYKVMLGELQRELEEKKQEIIELRDQLRDERMKSAGVE